VTVRRTLHPFRFGVIHEATLPTDAWIAHVQRVERLGYDTFLIRDHFVPDFFGDQLAPLPALTAAAMATTTLRVGTMVLDNDFRHPALLAKEVATIDSLSGGRFELGIGAGWLRAEYEQAGIPYDRAGVRIDRLEESLAVLKGLLRDGTSTFSGTHYVTSGLGCFPQPTQRPHPPIFIGGGKQRVLRLAGREADIVGILTTSVATGVAVDDASERTAAAVRQKLDWVREGAGDRFDAIELSLVPTVLLTDDREGVTERMIRERGWQGIGVADVLEMPSIFIGTIEQVACAMHERRESYGFSYYVVSDTQMEAIAPVVERVGNISITQSPVHI
jgi:probable F420-dependent oxidoreductase